MAVLFFQPFCWNYLTSSTQMLLPLQEDEHLKQQVELLGLFFVIFSREQINLFYHRNFAFVQGNYVILRSSKHINIPTSTDHINTNEMQFFYSLYLVLELYMFRTYFASIIRSTINCNSSQLQFIVLLMMDAKCVRNMQSSNTK